MSNPPSASTKSQSKSDKQRPQKPKSAAQRASEANRAQQLAVRNHTAQPRDRTAPGEHDTLLRKR